MTTGIGNKAAQLREVADQLDPTTTLTRIGERARFTVGAVSAVGTALTALGLLSADRLLQPGLARVVALVATMTATTAVALALSYLALRVTWINRRNLTEVENWLESELRRVRYVVWAGRLIVVAVLAAGAAGVLSALLTTPRANLVVQLLQDAGGGKATVQVKIDGGRPGEHYRVSLGRTGAGAAPPLLAAELMADGSGYAELDATVEGLKGVRSVTAEAWFGNSTLASGTANLASR
jgi:hypothetical protein